MQYFRSDTATSDLDDPQCNVHANILMPMTSFSHVPWTKKARTLNIEHQQQQQLTQKCQFLKICLESIFNFRRSRFLQKSEKTSSNPAKFLINFENKQKLLIFRPFYMKFNIKVSRLNQQHALTNVLNENINQNKALHLALFKCRILHSSHQTLYKLVRILIIK